MIGLVLGLIWRTIFLTCLAIGIVLTLIVAGYFGLSGNRDILCNYEKAQYVSDYRCVIR